MNQMVLKLQILGQTRQGGPHIRGMGVLDWPGAGHTKGGKESGLLNTTPPLSFNKPSMIPPIFKPTSP